MKDAALQEELDTAVWLAKTLFERGLATGSTSNLSFRYGDTVYISESGACFGRLTCQNFAKIELAGGECRNGVKPSKELGLHLLLYKKDSALRAVLHTHSFYSTLWSCLQHESSRDVVPPYTPYLQMKLGPVALVPYAFPGTTELFSLFGQHVSTGNGYLLAHHGPIVAAHSQMEALHALAELEESCHLAWELRKESAPQTKR